MQLKIHFNMHKQDLRVAQIHQFIALDQFQ